MGPSLTSALTGIFVVAIVALLALVLEAPGMDTWLLVVEAILALCVIYAGFRVARDCRSGRA